MAYNDGFRFRIPTTRREPKRTLSHEPIAYPESKAFAYDTVYPWGQFPYLCYFYEEENRTRWSNFYNKFILGRFPFVFVLDFGNVVSDVYEDRLLKLYREMIGDRMYNFVIVSFVKEGKWSRCSHVGTRFTAHLACAAGSAAPAAVQSAESPGPKHRRREGRLFAASSLR